MNYLKITKTYKEAVQYLDKNSVQSIIELAMNSFAKDIEIQVIGEFKGKYREEGKRQKQIKGMENFKSVKVLYIYVLNYDNGKKELFAIPDGHYFVKTVNWFKVISKENFEKEYREIKEEIKENE